MALVFISHVEEDEAVALSLAKGIEDAGFETWYYERDSVPGPTYLSQTRDAISKSGVILLVLSRASLRSRQVGLEVVCAHESGERFIPVLIDLTHDEFRRLKPDWSPMIGAAAYIQVGDLGVPAVLPPIIGSLRARAGGPPDNVIGSLRGLAGGPPDNVHDAVHDAPHFKRVAIEKNDIAYSRYAWPLNELGPNLFSDCESSMWEDAGLGDVLKKLEPSPDRTRPESTPPDWEPIDCTVYAPPEIERGKLFLI